VAEDTGRPVETIDIIGILVLRWGILQKNTSMILMGYEGL
jgi:hypothetical protein